MHTLSGVANDDQDLFASTLSVNHTSSSNAYVNDKGSDGEMTRSPLVPLPITILPGNARIHSDLNRLTPHTVIQASRSTNMILNLTNICSWLNGLILSYLT
jgi:hypothetical protein